MIGKDRIKKLLDKVYRLNYWFCNEMLIDEQHAAEFEEACKKANESGEPVIMVSAAEGNAKCTSEKEYQRTRKESRYHYLCSEGRHSRDRRRGKYPYFSEIGRG